MIFSMGSARVVAILLIFGYATLTKAVPMPNSNNNVGVTGSDTGNHDLHDLAAEFKSMMNESVKPCTNFRKFVCGNAPAKFNHEKQIGEKTTRELKSVFEDPSLPGELTPLTSAKNFYKACVNSDSDKKTYDWSSLREILKIFGGWPAVEGDSWSEENKSWRDLQIKLSKTAFNGFIEVTSHLGRSVRFDIIQPIFPYGNLDGGLNNAKVVEYRENLVDIAVAMGGEREKARMDIQQALEFDKTLSVGRSRNQFIISNDLAKTLNMSETEVINFWPPHLDPSGTFLFPEKIFIDFIKAFDSTSKRVLFTHALMRLAVNLTSFAKNSEDRQKECVNFVSAKLPDIQEVLYARKYFEKNTKSTINGLVQKLNAVLKEYYQHNPNVNEYGLYGRITDMINDIKYSLGYPDEFFDDEKISNNYKDLIEIREGDFLHGLRNYINYRLTDSNTFDIRKSLRNYAQPNNAIYLNYNKMYISMGYLRNFFTENLPKYVTNADFLLKLAETTAQWINMGNNFPDMAQISQDAVIQAVHSVYQEINSKLEPSLPGMELYNNEQMFWISLAHSQCKISDLSFIGYEKFRQAFNCSAA